MREIIHFILLEIRGTWRYRWAAMGVAWAICLIGWFLVMRMPNIYEARARVYVDAQSRLAEVMGQVGVDPGVGSRVFVVRQAMLARPQLEKVAEASGLTSRAESDRDLETMLLGLPERVVISSGRSSQASNLFTISFQDRDRAIAVKLVETLLDTFVTDVLKLKGTGSDDVNAYLDEQLTYYSGLLSNAELALATFKKEHVGLLPGESGGIFERLQTEMNLRDAVSTQLQIEIDRREELRRQLNIEDPGLPSGAQGSVGAGIPGTPLQAQIDGLESKRNDLLLTYTEKHPDLIAVVEQLEQLYRKRDEQRASLAGGNGGMEGASNATNPVYQSVQIALNESGVSIAALRSQLTQHQTTVTQLDSQIDTIPQVEAELAKLTRNYDQYRGLYSELLLRKERERMGTVGDEQDVVNFNVLEPPAASTVPVAPKRSLLITGILLLGIAAGIGIAYVLHHLNPVFTSAKSLRQMTGCPVLGVVSMTWLDRVKSAQRIDMSSFALVGAGLIVLFLASVIFMEPVVEFMRFSSGTLSS